MAPSKKASSTDNAVFGQSVSDTTAFEGTAVEEIDMEDFGSAKGQSTEFQGVSLIEEKEIEEELFFQTPITLFNTSTRTLS